VAAYNKFQSWVEYKNEGANVGSDQFVVALTNSAPVATNALLAELTPVDYTNCSTRNITMSSASQTGGTYTPVPVDLTLTASGGTVGPFRYVVIYDDTVSGDPLVCWFDYGSSITLAAGETILINFGSSLWSES
jgi:hypothetical protein